MASFCDTNLLKAYVCLREDNENYKIRKEFNFNSLKRAAYMSTMNYYNVFELRIIK